MRRWIVGFLALLMLVFGQQVFARDDGYILSRGYYLDKTNALTVDQVGHEKFTPYQNILTGGFSTGTYWVKLRIRDSKQALVLKVNPPHLEEIQLFDPIDHQSRPLVGAMQPLSITDVEALSYNFLLAPSVTDRDIYLRVKSVRSYLLYSEAMTMADYQRADRQEQLLYGAYSLFALMLAVWLFITWLIHRETILGVFTLQQCIAFLFTVVHAGLGKVVLDGYLKPMVLNELFSITAIAYQLIAYVANKMLLEEYGLKRFYSALFNLLIVSSVVVFGLYAFGSPIALKLANVFIISGMILFCVTGFFGLDLSKASFKASALSVNLLRFFYTFNLIVWLLTVLPFLGVLPLGNVALHLRFVYGMLSGLVFFILLQYRAKTLLKLETEKSSALKVEAEHERKQREEQGMLMAMLSHEIKTPLSVLKLVVDEKVAGSDLEGHANRAVHNIDFIVERCLQLGKLDADSMRLECTTLNFCRFVTDILEPLKAASRVRVQCAPDLLVTSDPDLLRVIFSNLFENALKYAPADSPITVVAGSAERDGVVGIEVVLTNEVGMMGAPDPAQMFKKYYRNPSATKVSGSGLGLFLVHELVGVLGGTVTYQPEEKRLRFSVWFPS